MNARKVIQIVLFIFIVLFGVSQACAEQIFNMKFQPDARENFIFTTKSLYLKIHPDTPGGISDGFFILKEGDPKLYFLHEDDYLELTRRVRYVIYAARAYWTSQGWVMGHFKRIPGIIATGPAGQLPLRTIDLNHTKIYAQLMPPRVQSTTIPNYYEIDPQPIVSTMFPVAPGTGSAYNAFSQILLAARPLKGIEESLFETSEHIFFMPPEYRTVFVRYGIKINDAKYLSFGTRLGR